MNEVDWLKHQLVVPGQVIAVASVSEGAEESDDSFLRGHGTYIEKTRTEQRLIASVTGIVQRVNKLITVESVCSSIYDAHTGDLVVGRIAAVGGARWSVTLIGHAKMASLPLSGVHLPGGVQRIRTAQDAREMRQYLEEGDIVSAEVHKVQADGTVFLHTRSFRYGKLENGCVITVSPSLVPRRKNHYFDSFLDRFEVLFGCNGMIWMQRKLQTTDTTTNPVDSNQDLAELQERRRDEHASLPYSPEERKSLARLRNSIECLRLTHTLVIPESVEEVFKKSIELNISLADMILPQNAIHLTASQRAL
ncbi:exosome complex component RRP4 [Fistulifera solaris]|uniref:Exosome complex component RRP4 n=1 Tax=Fistulifera solaris TaxID=1519565 RepID=A0A1Z5KGG2_FISSO|nr:exosome complex component RRP4 [Fistulifera solaris]|eukprot:GAX25296.1 exosome complex component RRP4 [Fistulifera solaris]